MEPGELEKQIAEIYMRSHSLRFASELVKSCFDNCVYNFRIRDIQMDEKLCMRTCAEKYFNVATHTSNILTSNQENINLDM